MKIKEVHWCLKIKDYNLKWYISRYNHRIGEKSNIPLKSINDKKKVLILRARVGIKTFIHESDSRISIPTPVHDS